MDKELPVSVWPEWKIIEKIGEGSFGKVYKAQRTEKGRSFYSAIKVLTIPSSKSELDAIRSETNNDIAIKEYFENLVEECIQEVSTMAYFRGNSHIVSVEDYKVIEYLDEIGWEINIRMEFLTSFTEYSAGKKLTEREVIQIGIDLCKALEYCAQINIVHRDIKPENVFVSRFGDFKLGDFGIARELEHSMSSMSKKGTYTYMSPEMYKGETYDQRSDIYSLGLMLYKLMNHNRLPFLDLHKQLITYRDKENALTRRISGEELQPPVDASPAFAEVIKKACSYQAEERYQTAEEMRKKLQQLYDGDIEHLSEKPQKEKTIEKTEIKESKTKKSKTKKSKTKILLIIMAVVITVGCVGVFAGIYFKRFLEDTVRKQTSEMLSLLESNQPEEIEKEVPSFAESIETIKERANYIVENLEFYEQKGKENHKLLYYNDEGELMKALVYPADSADGVYEEYFYWEGQMFFTYVWTEEERNLYYYQDGNMIRWIDNDDNTYDYDTENAEYRAREDKYWKNSVRQGVS